MAVKTNQYVTQRATTQDTSRGPSQAIWFDSPVEDFMQAAGGGIGTAGMHFFDDFYLAGQPALNAASSMGQWACFADTGATFVDALAEGGILQLSVSANPKQIALASNAGSFRLVSGATGFPDGQKLWFECRVAVGSIASGQRDFFIGLCDNTTSQIGSANNLVVATAGNTLITTKNLIGFHFRSTTNPTDVGFAYNVAGGTVQYPTGMQTLSTTVVGAAATAYAAVANGNPTGFIKLGFVYDPTPGNVPIPAPNSNNSLTQGTLYKPKIQVFVNGQFCPTFLSTTNVNAATFPTGWMSPTVVFGTQASSATGFIDWIRVAQLGSY